MCVGKQDRARNAREKKRPGPVGTFRRDRSRGSVSRKSEQARVLFRAYPRSRLQLRLREYGAKSPVFHILSAASFPRPTRNMGISRNKRYDGPSRMSKRQRGKDCEDVDSEVKTRQKTDDVEDAKGAAEVVGDQRDSNDASLKNDKIDGTNADGEVPLEEREGSEKEDVKGGEEEVIYCEDDGVSASVYNSMAEEDDEYGEANGDEDIGEDEKMELLNDDKALAGAAKGDEEKIEGGDVNDDMALDGAAKGDEKEIEGREVNGYKAFDGAVKGDEKEIEDTPEHGKTVDKEQGEREVKEELETCDVEPMKAYNDCIELAPLCMNDQKRFECSREILGDVNCEDVTLSCDVVDSVVLPFALFFKEDIEPFFEDKSVFCYESMLPYTKSHLFSKEGYPTIRYKAVASSKISDEQDTVSFIFIDKDLKYYSMKEILEFNNQPLFYICKKMKLKPVNGMVCGKVFSNDHLPIGSDVIKSSYCFCSPDGTNMMHMLNYKGEDFFDKEWFGCDRTGRWCHAQCMVRGGYLNSDWYEEYKDLKCRFGGSIPDDHSIYEDKRAEASIPEGMFPW